MRSIVLLSTTRAPWRMSAVFGASVLLFSGAMTSSAQAPADPHAQHATAAAAGQSNQEWMNQIAVLRAQVAKLQAAVQQTGPGKKSSANSGMPTSTAGKSGDMGAMGGMAPPDNAATPSGGGGMGMSSAQAPADPHAQHATADAAGQSNQEMMNQIAELRAQVAKLQAAVQQTGPDKKSSANSGMPTGTAGKSGGMGAMGGMAPPGNAAMPPGGGGMGMMDDKGEMGGMSAGGKGSMSSAPAAAMGMCCMGEMGGMSGGARGGMSGMGGGAAPPGGGMAAMSPPSSAMPGQPGASHLYHVGSTGFFLNHSQHITLTADQKFNLNSLKERAMLDWASEQRKIDQAEQELYALTGADQLDNSKVQAKLGEIEKLRAEQRMNFIRAVGEASNVLTHDQHLALMGTMTAVKK